LRRGNLRLRESPSRKVPMPPWRALLQGSLRSPHSPVNWCLVQPRWSESNTPTLGHSQEAAAFQGVTDCCV
jgi:hypothetical protein